MLENIRSRYGSPSFPLLHLPAAGGAAEHRRDLVALSQDLLIQVPILLSLAMGIYMAMSFPSLVSQMVSEAVLPCPGWTWSLSGRSLGDLPTLCAFTNHQPGAQAAKVSFQRENKQAIVGINVICVKPNR